MELSGRVDKVEVSRTWGCQFDSMTRTIFLLDVNSHLEKRRTAVKSTIDHRNFKIIGNGIGSCVSVCKFLNT